MAKVTLGVNTIKQDEPKTTEKKTEKKTKKISNYKEAKIYAIRSPNTKYYYIGSTTEKYLSQRLMRHNSDYIAYMNATNGKGFVYSFYVLEQGDAYIELIENFKCDDKHELKAREGHFIREGKEFVCNKYEAGRLNRTLYSKTYRDKKKRIEMLKEQIKEKQDIIDELEKEEDGS
jgi:hypothetical protein